jgi:hypothetical protein
VTVENPVFEVMALKPFKGIAMETGTLAPHEVEQRIQNMPVPPWCA